MSRGNGGRHNECAEAGSELRRTHIARRGDSLRINLWKFRETIKTVLTIVMEFIKSQSSGKAVAQRLRTH